jgi:BirA family transcriptional regulator, biotin operon repressor / biotin---[acetyl-CoA-carboxylase] ligase
MTVTLQPIVLRFDSIDSTNLEALRQAKAGAPEGLCIVAREQTCGKGRLDRSWSSPKDAGLYFSVILRPQLEMSAWPLITLMAALAVSDALRKACDLRTDIKWPNDIYANDRKLCGILAETVETDAGPAVMLGIGINLKSNALSAELRELSTSVESATGRQPDGELILQELVKAIAERYGFLHGPGGAEHMIREWCVNSTYAVGRRVQVSVSGGTLVGTTRGLESDGALRVETEDGKIRIIRAGDVTALRGMRDEG